VDLEQFQQLQEDQNAALEAVKSIWKKLKGVDPEEFQAALAEALLSARDIR
jgi:hypothetical protein